MYEMIKQEELGELLVGIKRKLDTGEIEVGFGQLEAVNYDDLSKAGIPLDKFILFADNEHITTNVFSSYRENNDHPRSVCIWQEPKGSLPRGYTETVFVCDESKQLNAYIVEGRCRSGGGQYV